MTLDGTDFARQLHEHNLYADLSSPHSASVGLLAVKVLRPSELTWAIAQGNDGGIKLAEPFFERGDGSQNQFNLPPIR